MSVHFRPAKRENTPLIVGIAGPTKSGKTYSAHRIAAGLAQGAPVVMINAEGAKGHQYADRFDYLATDITAPFRPERYTEVVKAALALEPRPAVVIIDSMSHMHDGPGGMLEYHEDELNRLAGNDQRRRDRSNFTAWVKPKAAENEFIYTLLEAGSHVILCFRAKEKLKIVSGQEPVNLGWQPIASDRITFETLFTLMLPPHSAGTPELALSQMREPFDEMISFERPLDEELGAVLAKWATGAATNGKSPGAPSSPRPAAPHQATGSQAAPQDSAVADDAHALNALVASMRNEGVISTRNVYTAVAQMRGLKPDEASGTTATDILIELLGGVSEDGELHWTPLREALTPEETAQLRRRLGQKWAESRAGASA